MLGHASNVVAGGLLAAMIVACVYCARDLWLRGTLRAWCVVGLMNIAMIAVHMPMPAHHHGIHAAAGQQSTLMGLATAIAAVEVAVAMAVSVLPHARERGADQRYTSPLSRVASARRTAGTRPTRLIAVLRIGRTARGNVANRVSRSVISTT